ncbi:MAG: DUF6176 family protein [Acidimicrobiales bacterium]
MNPTSIPSGLRVELSRQRLLPGADAEADAWMTMLNERSEECVATLEREQMALEIVFRREDDDGEWLYWVQVRGEGGAEELDESVPIDRDHLAFAKRSKEPGWHEAKPQFLLASPPVREALLAAAGAADSEPHR